VSDAPEAARGAIVRLAILVEGGLILLAVLLGRVLHRDPLEGFAWSLRDAGLGVAVTLPLAAVFLAIVWWPVGPLRSVHRFSVEVLCPLLAPCTVVDLVGIACLAGLGEEMLFRGVLQGSLEEHFGFGPALVSASILFGVLHAVTPAYAVLAALLGAYLGWAWHATGNLLVVVLAHALYDLMALLYLLRGPGRRLWAAAAERLDAEES
jgi:membrane protease YdiL (CAAX protease family)